MKSMNKCERGKRKAKLLIILVIAAAALTIAVLIRNYAANYLDSHGWLYSGQGTPQTVAISDKVRLERVMTFREGFRVCGIDGDTVIYSYRGKYGSVAPDGAAKVPYGVLGEQKEKRSDGTFTVNGVTLTAGKVLEAAYEDGRSSAVFDGWQLDGPRIYGEYIAARIYYCDCVYKIVHD